MIAKPQTPTDLLIYPDSDGEVMADNTLQFSWIVLIKENLEALFASDPHVFVAGDLLWYPLQGELKSTAPDAMVVFGRPKGYRGSYKQWEEDNIAPQVVFEILSPSNTARKMMEKCQFYKEHGVEEYYIYDPDTNVLEGWQRFVTQENSHEEARFISIDPINQWVSPRLGIKFDLSGEELVILDPEGNPFVSFSEEKQRRIEAEELLKRYREQFGNLD